MDIIRPLEEKEYPLGTVITVGVFDGVHVGHQQILEEVKRQTRPGQQKLAVTFHPHPDILFRPEGGFRYIQTLDDRIDTLKKYGCDDVIVLEFDRTLADTTPEMFIDYLIDEFEMQTLVLGWDFALGKGRAGNYEVLKKLGEERGIRVVQVPAFQFNDEIVSSTVIRKAITEGDLDKANSMLGRPFKLTGKVEHGKHIGTDVLHFPTANFSEDPNIVLPPNGVYAANVHLADGSVLPSATFIGTRPTFNGVGKKIEMHILDFSGDIYEQDISIDFIKMTRGEIKFSDPKQLAAQIDSDIKGIRKILA